MGYNEFSSHTGTTLVLEDHEIDQFFAIATVHMSTEGSEFLFSSTNPAFVHIINYVVEQAGQHAIDITGIESVEKGPLTVGFMVTPLVRPSET